MTSTSASHGGIVLSRLSKSYGAVHVLVAARPGATVSEIAAKLFLSEGTVRNYLSAAIAKAGARNRAEAVRTADERGWL
jgi:DNA-binding NarL/FixJ family response regulator